MTEYEYKKWHIKLWQEIVDYLHKTKRGYVKIDYKYYKYIADLKADLLNTQNENSGVVFTEVYHDCYACKLPTV